MTLSSLPYIEPVFRPPSEAQSVIFQVTNGCSWGRCTFCEMYTEPQKKFSIRPEAEVLSQIEKAGERYGVEACKIFLADGDAMVLSTSKLLRILSAIAKHFPLARRVGAYCLPKNIVGKSVTELQELCQAGLKMVYVGAESGDDTVLRCVNKNETFSSTVEGLLSLKKAGISRSVMIVNGIGGSKYSRQHAVGSAALVNATQPEFLATLVISFPNGQTRIQKSFPEFVMLDQHQLFDEMMTFIEHTDLTSTIFRSDHASNYLVLKGTLGKDKAALMDKLDVALNSPDQAQLRPEWSRGL